MQICIKNGMGSISLHPLTIWTLNNLLLFTSAAAPIVDAAGEKTPTTPTARTGTWSKCTHHRCLVQLLMGWPEFNANANANALLYIWVVTTCHGSPSNDRVYLHWLDHYIVYSISIDLLVVHNVHTLKHCTLTAFTVVRIIGRPLGNVQIQR